ncbi:DUF2780 domain-containing protein, partial [Pseudomonas citri]|uniref:DUF2780 domain-containing protein n=1 Tax=Pseudomonas citri TaxID=2978349 RepID=UPI0021B67F38
RLSFRPQGLFSGESGEATTILTPGGALGMDGGMISRFAPIILQFLGQQGVGSSLLQSLGGVWGSDG